MKRTKKEEAKKETRRLETNKKSLRESLKGCAAKLY